MLRRSRTQVGFTLVEVLVALLIMATMAVIAWRGIDSMLRGRDISQASLLRSERLQTVLAQWEQDLRSLQDSGLSEVAPIGFDGASLRLTRQRPEGLQLVVWSLRAGRLLRWESAPVTRVGDLTQAYSRSQQTLALDGRELVALEGLAGWQMHFYRGNAWSNAQSSDDLAAPSTEGKPAVAAGAASAAGPGASAPAGKGDAESGGAIKRQLPSGVRMVLEFAPGSGIEGQLTRQLLLGPQP